MKDNTIVIKESKDTKGYISGLTLTLIQARTMLPVLEENYTRYLSKQSDREATEGEEYLKVFKQRVDDLRTFVEQNIDQVN